MFENPRRGRQTRNFTTNVSKILDLKSSSEQIFFRKLSLGAPAIWQCCWPVATKMPFLRRNSSLLQIFSAATQEGNLLFLAKRSARKKLYNFPIKLTHLCRTSRHVWLSCSVCDPRGGHLGIFWVGMKKITSEVKFAERKSALLQNNNVWKQFCLLFSLTR